MEFTGKQATTELAKKVKWWGQMQAEKSASNKWNRIIFMFCYIYFRFESSLSRCVFIVVVIIVGEELEKISNMAFLSLDSTTHPHPTPNALTLSRHIIRKIQSRRKNILIQYETPKRDQWDFHICFTIVHWLISFVALYEIPHANTHTPHPHNKHVWMPDNHIDVISCFAYMYTRVNTNTVWHLLRDHLRCQTNWNNAQLISNCTNKIGKTFFIGGKRRVEHNDHDDGGICDIDLFILALLRHRKQQQTRTRKLYTIHTECNFHRFSLFYCDIRLLDFSSWSHTFQSEIFRMPECVKQVWGENSKRCQQQRNDAEW